MKESSFQFRDVKMKLRHNGVDAVITYDRSCGAVLGRLSGLPGRRAVAYRDGNFALILRSGVASHSA